MPRHLVQPTPEKVRTLHRFGEFPWEVREMIWLMAIPARLIETRTRGCRQKCIVDSIRYDEKGGRLAVLWA